MREAPSPGTLVITGIALLLLLALTAGLAWFNLGPFSPVVALLIAAAKAILILLIFMEIRYSKLTLKVFMCVGFVWLGILFTLALSDYLSRGYLHIPGK
jgi:cytochrome c oxidase subunit 4